MRNYVTILLLVMAIAAVPLALSCRKPTDEETKSADTKSEAVTGETAPTTAPEETMEPEETAAPEAPAEPETTAGPEADKDEDKAEIPPSDKDPDLKTILSRYYDAIGGPEKWSKVKATPMKP